MFTAAALKSEQWKQISPSTRKTKQATLNLPCADENSQPLFSVYLACLWNGPWPVISRPSRCACVGRGTTALSQWWEAARLPAKAMLNAGLGLLLRRARAAKSQDFHPTVLSGTLFSVVILPLDEWQWGDGTCRVIQLLAVRNFWRDCDGDHWCAGWHTPSLFFKWEATTLLTTDARSA